MLLYCKMSHPARPRLMHAKPSATHQNTLNTRKHTCTHRPWIGKRPDQTDTQWHLHARILSDMYTHMHDMHAETQRHTQRHTHRSDRHNCVCFMFTHTLTHTLIHAHTHAHAHTHTHT